MELSPWTDLNSRYGHDSDAQFLLFVEQLSQACDLARSGELANLRMALVSADNLAEMLLHRHKEQVLRVGGESNKLDLPRLDTDDLRELARDFGARVRLGRRAGGEGMASSMLWSVLDERDEVIFRTAHAYRNRVYHADHHNEAVLPLITRAYLGAVARSFVRLQPANVGGSLTRATEKLVDYGLQPRENHPAGATFWPAEAAQQITANLTARLKVDLDEARRVLREDLTSRTAWASAMVSELLEDGMPPDRLLFRCDGGSFGILRALIPRSSDSIENSQTIGRPAFEACKTRNHEASSAPFG